MVRSEHDNHISSDMGLLAMANFLEMSGALISNGKPYKKPDLATIPTEVDISNSTGNESDKQSTTLCHIVPPCLYSP